MDILLKNFTLIDGTGRAPVNDASILSRDGKIVWAGPASGGPEAKAEVISVDLGGGYVLPGLIDAIEHGTYLYQDPTAIQFMAENLLPSCSVEHASAKGKQYRNIEPPVREAHVYKDFLQSIHYTQAKAVSAYG